MPIATSWMTATAGLVLTLTAALWLSALSVAAQAPNPRKAPVVVKGAETGNGKIQSRIAAIQPAGDLPRIVYDPAALPAPVRDLREKILEAARSGDMENLRAVIATNKVTLEVSFGGADDPIAFWKQISANGTGRDVLADMVRVFESGFVHVDANGDNDLYIWPYHFAYPLNKLTPRQEVELYMLIPGEYRAAMEELGGYTGFRAGITPKGEWEFFIAGD